MKRIKLYAYWAQNFGDDLMVHILLTRFPQYEFFCESWDDSQNRFLRYRNFNNLTKLQGKYGRINHLFNILTFYKSTDFYFNRIVERKKNECSASIYIGGSIYMQNNNESGAERIQREECKLQASPLFVIGANFGQYQTDEFRAAFDRYFRRVGGVTFRDEVSFKLFQKDNPLVRYAPDVVFNLETRDLNNVDQDNSVVISIIDTKRRKSLHAWADLYEEKILELCHVCIQSNKVPVLMSFCKQEGDEDAITRILENMPTEIRKQIKTYFYSGNIDEALEVISRSERVIATRFHAMILALKFGKPFYCLSYDSKIKHVLRDLNYEGYCEFKDLENARVQEMLEYNGSIEGIEQYIASAADQFAQFEDYINC